MVFTKLKSTLLIIGGIIGLLFLSYVVWTYTHTLQGNADLKVAATQDKQVIQDIKADLGVLKKDQDIHSTVAASHVVAVTAIEQRYDEAAIALENKIAAIRRPVPKAVLKPVTASDIVAPSSTPILDLDGTERDYAISKARIAYLWQNFCTTQPEHPRCTP